METLARPNRKTSREGKPDPPRETLLRNIQNSQRVVVDGICTHSIEGEKPSLTGRPVVTGGEKVGH